MFKRTPTETGLSRVFQEISQRGEVTASALARSCRLKPAALGRQLRALAAQGLVTFQNGRRKILVNPHFGYVVGVDVGASHLHYALADFRGKILGDTNQKIRPEDGPRKMIAQMKDWIRRLAGEYAKRGRLLGLAVCVPSGIDPRTGRVSFANNLPGWKNIDLGRQLAQTFRVPVRVENDANAAAMGERWLGIARGTDSFVFVALGTGIGSGVFVHGKLHSGRTGNAGELFKLNVEWQRWAEDFGDTGYFESYASGMGIAATGREFGVGSGQAEGDGLAETRDARFVFDAFHRGDPRARAALEKVFIILGVGLADLVAVVDPDLIVLGGGIAKGAPEFMLETVEKVVRTIQPDPPPIRLSALEDKAQTYGAIYSALEAARDSLARRLG